MNQIGKFKILRELGSGGFGAVYLGEDPDLGDKVAIKVFRIKDQALAREASFEAKLKTSNTISSGLEETKISHRLTKGLVALILMLASVHSFGLETVPDAITESSTDTKTAANANLAKTTTQPKIWDTGGKKEQNKETSSKNSLLHNLGIQLVTIPSGSFRIGFNDGDELEKPIDKVSISSFKMMVHEVTWDNYQPCIDAGVCLNNDAEGGDEGWGKGKRPVINVSWGDAQTYIKWLNQKTGQTFRLPSEAEWEYAARAGHTTTFSWGNHIGKNNANCDGCGSKWDDIKTAPVGSFNANAFGLYDMHGNVWELTQGCWIITTVNAPSQSEAWTLENCTTVFLRGGSWLDVPHDLRSAYRSKCNINSRFSSLGFRLVQSL